MVFAIKEEGNWENQAKAELSKIWIYKFGKKWVEKEMHSCKGTAWAYRDLNLIKPSSRTE